MLGIETGIRQIYTIIPWQLRHKLNYFIEMLKVSKNAFLKEQIFVKENIENLLTYLVGNVLFLKMKSSKLSNYFSLDFGGMEKYFLFQLLHVCKLTSVLETAN
jgi:hypothetical protein